MKKTHIWYVKNSFDVYSMAFFCGKLVYILFILYLYGTLAYRKTAC
jgi:hypothetical protein